MLRHFITFIFLLTAPCFLYANDGVFVMKGNQLIPIQETDIEIRKEVLTLEKVNQNYLQVKVGYRFYNPDDPKDLLVGFEAAPPSGNAITDQINYEEHPFISDFTVKMNGQSLLHKTSIVKDSNYYQNDTVDEKSTEFISNQNISPDFFYVYHFKAPFKKGANTIEHTYRFKLSSTAYNRYNFRYILTSVNRWANNGIDDFTLKINMGPYADFYVKEQFFDGTTHWDVDGNILKIKEHPILGIDTPSYRFRVENPPIVFHKKNFHPDGELALISSKQSRFYLNQRYKFNKDEHNLPYSIETSLSITKAINKSSVKILRNLPFARRGYVFSSDMVQEYYEKHDWYMPNKDYKGTMDSLTPEELKWYKKVRSNKWNR